MNEYGFSHFRFRKKAIKKLTLSGFTTMRPINLDVKEILVYLEKWLTFKIKGQLINNHFRCCTSLVKNILSIRKNRRTDQASHEEAPLI